MAQHKIPPVALVGALDTKYAEYGFVQARLAQHEVASILIDTGVLGEPRIQADIDRHVVAQAAGAAIDTLAMANDRSTAMTTMAAGAARLVQDLYRDMHISGVMVLGGSNAGFVMSQLADALPIGCPKLLVSTIVAGDTRPYVQATDLTMMYPIVDIAGLNAISTPVLARAADAMAGMVAGPDLPKTEVSTSVGCTMFGVTTPCVTAIHDDLTDRQIEVEIFHATGTGGRSFERLIRARRFAAVADITTTELADELCGGVCSAGPDRLTAAAQSNTPQVVSVGALDMANFGPADSVPERYAGRLILQHNPTVTLMRTSPEECAQLGRIIATKLNTATAFTEVHIPTRGFSQISTPDEPFYDPSADQALIDSLRAALDPAIPVHTHPVGINDPDFARQIIDALNRALHTQKGPSA